MKNLFNRHKLNTQGFTLLEVLVATVILSIGILSLYSMQISSIRGNSQANAMTIASNAARDQIETLIGKGFSDGDFTTGIHTGGAIVPPITSISWTVTDWSSDGIDNDIDTPISKIDEFDERGVKSIQLTINYTDKGILKSNTTQFLKTEIF